MFWAIDDNFFATTFHTNMFARGFAHLTNPDLLLSRMKIVGWPMDYLPSSITPGPKEDIVLFPHRLAPEKQPEIFKMLRNQLPQYKFLICQEMSLTKDEYRELLGKAKIVFSANLQETLGISPYEGMIAGAIPLLPNRLSYTEMYPTDYLYPSEWTIDFTQAARHIDDLLNLIVSTIDDYGSKSQSLEFHRRMIGNDFFSGKSLCSHLPGYQQ